MKKFNYLFGANAAGKTTISRIIDSPGDYTSCSITWQNQTPLETRGYNRNLVVRNFNKQKPDAIMIEKFLEVFKQIFQKAGHISHYNMMMRIYPEVENTEVNVSREVSL